MTSHEAPCCHARVSLLAPPNPDEPRSPFAPFTLPSDAVVPELRPDGMFITRDNRTQRVADFSAVMCSWSMFLSDETAFVHVLRNGECFDFELTQAEQDSGSWVLDRLGAGAAASVSSYPDVVAVITFFSVRALREYHGGGGDDAT